MKKELFQRTVEVLHDAAERLQIFLFNIDTCSMVVQVSRLPQNCLP